MTLLLVSPSAAHAQQGTAAEYPPFSASSNRAPFYPVEELWRLLDYTVNVIIETMSAAACTVRAWSSSALVRNRLVSDGQHRFVVSSVLCGRDLEVCRHSLAQLRANRTTQQPLPVDVPTP